MDWGNRTWMRTILLLGCVLFDAAMILLFFTVFAWFSVLAPIKSLFMLAVLLLGLLIVNVIVIFPRVLFRQWGTAYAVFMTGAALFYTLVANVSSIVLIDGSTLLYIVWELLIIAIFFVIIAIVSFFVHHRSKDVRRDEMEKSARAMILAQLFDIEETLREKNVDNAYLPLVQAFGMLKERMQASTPFARIMDNQVVEDLEDEICNHMMSLQIDVKMDFTEEHVAYMQKTLNNIRRLVMHREQLIIN